MRKSYIPAVERPLEGSYEGHPTLTFPNPEDHKKPGVCLGVRKIQAVLQNLEEAKAFVAKHHKPEPQPAPINGIDREKLNALAAKLGLSKAQIAMALA